MTSDSAEISRRALLGAGALAGAAAFLYMSTKALKSYIALVMLVTSVRAGSACTVEEEVFVTGSSFVGSVVASVISCSAV